MYSLLLMTAVAAGPDTASFGWRTAGCAGCAGYTTSCYGSSCYGSSYGSCYGSSCYGSCYGSSCSGSSCYGSSCYGSCTGSSCHGGLFHGGLLNRFHTSRSWWTQNGCCGGSCYGSSCHGSSCYGSSCYGSSCYGSSGFGGCAGTIISPEIPGTIVPSTSVEIPAIPTTKAETIKESASLTIELPASARLFVDGMPTNSTGAVRQFHTPELEPGQAFFYDFKAEITIDGKVEVEQKRVVVRAGMKMSESFPKLIAAAKAATTTVVSATK